MGWIVRDACQRLRSDIGCYAWNEWRRAADRLGLVVIITDGVLLPPACLVEDAIVVRRGFSSKVTAHLIWHEIGHHVLHAGTPDVWRTMRWGPLLLQKWERQADEFAAEFPQWGERLELRVYRTPIGED